MLQSLLIWGTYIYFYLFIYFFLGGGALLFEWVLIFEKSVVASGSKCLDGYLYLWGTCI